MPSQSQVSEARFALQLAQQALRQNGWIVDDAREDAQGLRLIAHRPYAGTEFLTRPGFGEVEK